VWTKLSLLLKLLIKQTSLTSPSSQGVVAGLALRVLALSSFAFSTTTTRLAQLHRLFHRLADNLALLLELWLLLCLYRLLIFLLPLVSVPGELSLSLAVGLHQLFGIGVVLCAGVGPHQV